MCFIKQNSWMNFMTNNISFMPRFRAIESNWKMKTFLHMIDAITFHCLILQSFHFKYKKKWRICKIMEIPSIQLGMVWFFFVSFIYTLYSWLLIRIRMQCISHMSNDDRIPLIWLFKWRDTDTSTFTAESIEGGIGRQINNSINQ